MDDHSRVYVYLSEVLTLSVEGVTFAQHFFLFAIVAVVELESLRQQ